MEEKTQKSALGWLNLLLPKDGGTDVVVSDLAYGRHERQALDVYRPKRADDELPLLFFIYGGGWNSGSKADYEFAGRAFAKAGFLTVVADYRVTPEGIFPVFLNDCAEAINFIAEHAGAWGCDISRLFLAGHSAGAYNAAMLGLQPQRFGLHVPIKGVAGLSGPYDFYPFDVKESIETFSHVAEPELTQPINLVKDDAPAFYLGHGTRDKTCLPRNTRAMAMALRERDVAVTERYYKGWAHAAPLLSLFPALRWLTPAFSDVVRFAHDLS